jgi:hypothetical protein
MPLARKTKLTYHFHNPNTIEATAEMLFRVFLQSNQAKADQAIQEALARLPNQIQPSESDCAK